MRERSIHKHLRRVIGSCNNPPGLRFLETATNYREEDIKPALNELIDLGDIEMIDVGENMPEYKYKLKGV